jgi:hypothetical protein
MPKPPPAPPRRTYREILGLGVFGLVLASLPMLAYFTYDHPWILMVLSFFYIVVAFVMRSRLIICTLIGILLGLIFDSGVKDAAPETRLWIFVGQLTLGVLVGILAGLVWERTEIETDEPVRAPSKKRR